MSEGEASSFAEVLEDCSRRVREGEDLDGCLLDYPVAYRAELAHLVPLTQALSQLARDPSPEFQERLERRWLNEIEGVRQETGMGPRARIARLFVVAPVLRVVVPVLIAVLILGGAGAGVVQAADSSLPDSPLYQVKTVRESAELLLAQNPEVRAEVYLRQIARRGRELELAIRTDKPRRVLEVLAQRFEGSTELVVDQSLALRARGNPRPANQTLILLDITQERLRRLLPDTSPDARSVVLRLQLSLREQEQRLR